MGRTDTSVNIALLSTVALRFVIFHVRYFLSEQYGHMYTFDQGPRVEIPSASKISTTLYAEMMF